jgi:hypothetical protein
VTAYDEAIQAAAATGRPFFVNRLTVNRDEQVLVAQPGEGRLCCAIAHPDGTLERVVQGYCHAVALSTSH